MGATGTQPHAGAAHSKSQTPRGLHPAAPPTQEERFGGEEVSENSSGALVERGEVAKNCFFSFSFFNQSFISYIYFEWSRFFYLFFHYNTTHPTTVCVVPVFFWLTFVSMLTCRETLCNNVLRRVRPCCSWTDTLLCQSTHKSRQIQWLFFDAAATFNPNQPLTTKLNALVATAT